MRTRDVQRMSKVVLVLVDVINHFEFPEGAGLLRNARPIAANLARLKRRARSAGVATIYVNDNFGQWRSDTGTLLRYCLRPEAAGGDFVRAVAPDDEDYFVLKPMHSAFYQTPLDTLLHYLNARSIILAGLATNSCIVYSAHDAKMREFNLCVPSDCCAARTKREHSESLSHIETMVGGKVIRSASIRFPELAKGKTP